MSADLLDNLSEQVGALKVENRILRGQCDLRDAGIETLKIQLDRFSRALHDLMPFVLEDYMPDLATPEFKAAVEAAKAITGHE